MQNSASPLSGFRWAYGLVLLPLATEWIEAGHFPLAPRDWLTEFVLGAVVLAFVHTMVRQADRLHELALSDPLTGLSNRRAFDGDLDRHVALARRDGVRLSLAYLDIDRFKQVNDRFGHDAGDSVLRTVALVLRRDTRLGVDLTYRLGGDEFAVLMPGADSDRAREAVDRLRRAVLEGPGGLEAFEADVSVGVVELQPGESLAEFYLRADAAMYSVKRDRQTSVRSRLEGPAGRG